MFISLLAQSESTGGVADMIGPLLSLLAIIGGVLWWRDRKAERQAEEASERSIQAGGKVTARLGFLVLFDEPPRLRAPSSDYDHGPVEEWKLSSSTSASVEASGNVSTTRGRNLAAKAVGGALVPGGVFVFGNARETVHDHRELYLIVEDNDWAYTRKLDPSFGTQARRFAQAVNIAARKLGPAQSANGDDPITRLERLAQLRESGALTDAEFETQKNAVLQS
jgi:hypothetical protein